jgi:MFS family permease
VRAPGQLREGLRYVARTPELGVPLLMMALVGCLAYEFQVVLPVVAKETFHGGPQAYGLMTGAMGVGAVIGGLYVAARGRTGIRAMTTSSLAFAVVLLFAALAPTMPVELLALALVGGVSVGFLSKGNSTLQLSADPSMRGRVMALWAVAFLGSTPIGGPIAGAVSEHFGGRSGLGMAAVACLLAAVAGVLVLRRQSSREDLVSEPANMQPLQPVGAQRSA